MDELSKLLERSVSFHDELFALWEELPPPVSKRVIAVVGFTRIVQQHVIAQYVLIESDLDLPAMTLVRPTFEAAVRAIWCLKGASDGWIEQFLSPPSEGRAPDEETIKGPPIESMLSDIRAGHPEWLHDSLSYLYGQTKRAMHSYVHGGIRPIVQSFAGLPEQQQCAVLLNANAVLILATNALRMALDVGSPMLSELQRKYADCLPPTQLEKVSGTIP